MFWDTGRAALAVGLGHQSSRIGRVFVCTARHRSNAVDDARTDAVRDARTDAVRDAIEDGLGQPQRDSVEQCAAVTGG